MEFREPGRFEVMMTLLFTRTFFRPYYARHVSSMRLRGDEMVLDFGSGSGMEAKLIAAKLPEGHLTCVDISRNWLGVARRALSGFDNVDFRQGRLSHLDLPEESFDVIVVNFVIHDIDSEERSGILRELVGKLAKGGRIFIREPLRAAHGLPASEIRQLMTSGGLREENSSEKRTVYEGVYVR